ncbi:MAG: hypothetical protein K0S04_1144 [Herbinix sp.]|nr:hypothetical protein [Herbinix sp.]
MSNFDLRAKVNQLELQLHQVENENAMLRSEIAATVSNINNADSELDNYNRHIRNTLDQAAGVINSSINKALNAYEVQGEIDNIYLNYKNVELANKRIRALNNKKYYDFNNYRTVRKIVQGIMDNLDLSMVSDNVIYRSIEKQHLMTPDFWLTSALISIMAWKNDDKALADKAVNRAIQLDKKSSSIFYMIFNLRMDREEAALKWFLIYQQCKLTTSDESAFLMLFSLISKTLNDSVDVKTAVQIKEFINNMITRSMEREGYHEGEVVSRIQNNMQRMMTSESYDFPLMSKCCKSYGTIITMLNMAHNNYHILELIYKIKNVRLDERNRYLNQFMTELLNKPNPNEKETYDQIEYNELIIRLSGNVDRAKVIFEESRQRQESDLDLMSSIISWTYDFTLEHINEQMRLNMFTLIKGIQEKAVHQCFDSYQALHRNTLPIEIGEYSAEVDFTEKSKELEKINKFYESKADEKISKIKYTGAFVAFGIGVVCIIAAFFTHLYLIGGGLVCTLFGGIKILANKRMIKNIIIEFQNMKRVTQETLQSLFDEFVSCEKIYSEKDNISKNILEELI